MSICGLGKALRGYFWGYFVNSIFLFSFVIAFDIESVFHLQLELQNSNKHIIKTSSIVLLLQFYLFLYNIYGLFPVKLWEVYHH